MDAQTLTYIFVALSFALYIGIAIWSRAGSTNEFYVAERRASGGKRHGDRCRLPACRQL